MAKLEKEKQDKLDKQAREKEEKLERQRQKEAEKVEKERKALEDEAAKAAKKPSIVKFFQKVPTNSEPQVEKEVSLQSPKEDI